MPFRRVAQGIVASMLLMGAVTVVGERRAGAVTTFTVTKAADTNDGTCDSDCSLHEAAAAASATSGASQIDFAVNGTFPITFGDIALATEITVNGNGRTNTVIDGGNSTRVFATDTAPVTLQHLTIENGAQWASAATCCTGENTAPTRPNAR